MNKIKTTQKQPGRPGKILAALALLSIGALVACEEKDFNHCFIARDDGGEILRETVDTCSKPLPLASTFKIPNALIALETGALSSPAEKIEWDGFEHPFDRWNRDQDLTSAMRYSVPWFFMSVASRNDPARMRELLQAMDFRGQGDIEKNPYMFWLNGDLRISPADELDFLARFFKGELKGVKAGNQRLVRDLLLQKAGKLTNALGEKEYDLGPAAGDLYAKTGYLDLPDGERVSWLVGQLVRGEESVVFVSSVFGKDARITPFAGAAHAREKLIELAERKKVGSAAGGP